MFSRQFRNDIAQHATYAYFGVLVASAASGAVIGADQFFTWMNARPYRRLPGYLTNVERIVNSACDVGVLVGLVASCALANATMIAFAPITIPLAMFYAELEEEEKEEKKKEKKEKKEDWGWN